MHFNAPLKLDPEIQCTTCNNKNLNILNNREKRPSCREIEKLQLHIIFINPTRNIQS